MTSPKPSRRRPRLLAAPIVITASLGGACEYKTYTNPLPPQRTADPLEVPSAEPSAVPSAEPVASVSASANASPTADPGPLAEIPKGPGRIQKNPDGSCSFHFPPPSMECPPTARCNPGPPRMPIKVKCPPDAAGQP